MTDRSAPGRGRADPGASDRRPVVPAIDGFRGFAALAVLFYHVAYGAARAPLDDGIIRNVLISGYMGVDFFFVISGFVLFLPMVVNGGQVGNVRAYALRRAARIIPAFYVALLVTVVLYPVFTGEYYPPISPPFSWEGLLSTLLHLSFLQHSVGLLLTIPEGFGFYGLVWTLNLEVCFYIVLPFIAARYYRRPFLGLALAMAIGLAWRTAALQGPISLPWFPGAEGQAGVRLIMATQFPSYVGHFAAGMTAAWLFVRLRGRFMEKRWFVTVPVATAALVAVIWGMSSAGIRDVTATAGLYDHWTNTTFVALAFAVLMLATALAPRWAQLPVANPLSRRLGDISYGVYLWHLLMIALALNVLHLVPEGTNWSFFRLLAFVLPASLLAGTLSLVLVERPAIKWARRRSRLIERRAAERGERRSPSGARDGSHAGSGPAHEPEALTRPAI